MDKIKASRKQNRRLFTIACNDFFESENRIPNDEKISKLKLIESKAKLMLASEYEYREALLSSNEKDEQVDKEIDESECYIDKWRNLENKLNDLLNEKQEMLVANSFNNSPSTLLHYPKIKLPSFDGNIKNWLGFWGQFQKIDKDPNLDNHDKFAYLAQAMEKNTSAEELIKSFPPGGESYEKALKQLQARYGRDELLIEVYVRDLLSIIMSKQKSERLVLRKLYDQLESKLRALETLGVTKDKYAAMLYPLVESAIPNETLRAWERFRSANRRSKEELSQEGQVDGSTTAISNLDRLLTFLQDEVESEERIVIAAQSFNRSVKVNNFDDRRENHQRKCQSRVSTANELLYSSQNTKKSCIFCSADHKSWNCRKAQKMTLEEKQTAVENAHCCFLCLKEGHGVKNCKSKFNCQLCGKKHNLLLCKSISKEPTSTSQKNESETKIQQDEALASFSKTPNVILQTFAVIMRGQGIKRKARAIIDTGSQRSYILRSTAREMNYQSNGKEYLQHSLFGGSNTAVCQHDVFTVYLSNSSETYNCHFNALSQPVICETISAVTREPYIQELSKYGIRLTDDIDGPIEVLIGADIAGKLSTGNCKQLKCGITALETKLGWTIIGRTNNDSMAGTITSMLTTNACISQLWALDSLGITDPSEKKTAIELQEAAKQQFLNTVKVENDRFVVHMPWIESHLPLPDNFELCLKRLDRVKNNLRKEGLYELYGNVFKDWLDEGIIELVPLNELDLPAHYLPHRPVIKENSTTRIRPVFDASAKQKGSPSLNDCLESGINLIELIPTVLYRFRLERIGVIADIRKAFLQISISPSDKNYLRFLWFGENGELKHYRHCRVVFGVSCSPFLLGIVIQYHLQNVLKSNNDEYPENMIKLLMNSFYVDNCVTSVRNKDELEFFIKMATTVMAQRKFDLRGWEYTNLADEARSDTNVLGILWNKEADTLGTSLASFKMLCFEKVTKKVILSAAHRIFDPIGVTCPVSLFPKLLLQKLWSTKINWEEEVDSLIKNEFLKWVKNISHLENVRIPRYLRSGDINEKCSLHFFSDASKYAYAAAVFIRVETSESVKVQLLQARSRVSPSGKRATTIARLELLAATILSRLASTILSEIPHEEIYFWTDSTTVLTWIKREEPWNTFVNNRVQEIRTLTSKERWRHVPGLMNPADLPSRGCSGQQLLKSKWWEGPEWLYLAPDMWPSTEFVADENEILKERKKSIRSSSDIVLITNNENIETDWYYRYYSQYEKIVFLIGWILRFLRNCRTSEEVRKRGSLDSEEFVEAEKRILMMIQRETFINEKDEKLKFLEVFKDQEGIIRLRTKIVYREDCDDFRKPAILPSQHKVVRLLVFHHHVKNGHAGTQILLNILREHFWILNGRRTVRSVISKCVKCKRYSGRNLDAITAPLPENRVRDAAVFEITGVDCAGPLILKGHEKVWVCLFTCAIYRAVHLELVSAMTTEAFLLALRRFIARRGRCSVIYCDNGTNFVGAANVLQSLDWDRISKYSAVNRIQWKFNPPSASWWGGWWERLIRIMKGLLKRILGRACLTYEELITVLCDCESIMNSRPLTYVSEKDSELVPLTPSLFMQDIKESGVPDCDDADHNSLNKRVKYRLALQRELRKRFRSEYLGALVQKPKSKRWSTIAVGDVVIIGSDNRKRLEWPLGRVAELLPGTEGVVRLVKLQTADRELIRPIQRLYPLEITSSEAKNIQKQVVKNHAPRPKMSEQRITTPVVSEREIKRTRCGRTINVPVRLDL